MSRRWTYLLVLLATLGCSSPGNGEVTAPPELDVAEAIPPSPPEVSVAKDLHPLPFGPDLSDASDLCDVSSPFFLELIGNPHLDQPAQVASYPLPELGPIEFIVVDSANRSGNCSDGRHISSHLKFASYKKRLPPLGDHAMYYVSDAARNQAYTEGDPDVCPDLRFDYYGFLLQVAPGGETARSFLLYSHRFIDALVVRTFYIDPDYRIHLCEKEFTDDGDGGSEMTLLWTATLELLPDGSFNIQKTHS